jgi:hypothetical protein
MIIVYNLFIIIIKGEYIMEFKVKGTSYENEDGKNRQKIIQEVINTYIDNEQIYADELYDGNTNKDIKDYDLKVSIYEGISFPAKLKKSKYKDEDCIEVYLIDYYKNKQKVGYIPKELVHTIWNSVDENEEIPVEIIGGKYKEYDILEEKVITNDVGSYGVKIEYITDEEREKNKLKRKELEQKILKEKENKKNKEIREVIIELIICIFLGIFGVHKFYKGKIKIGILYLFTGGLFGIGWIIDTIKLINKLIKIKAQ